MTDIEKVAIFDDRIVQTRPKYGCEKGAVSLTNSPFNSISASASQMTYQIQVPSENVFVDRAIDWSSTCALQLTITLAGAAPTTLTPLLDIATDVALASFPLHTLVQTLSASINDTTVTMNTGDVLREVLRLTDNPKNRSLRTCPTALDTYANYNNASNAVNNPLGGFNVAGDTSQVPNGAYPNFYFTAPNGDPLTKLYLTQNWYVDPNNTTANNRIYFTAAGIPIYAVRVADPVTYDLAFQYATFPTPTLYLAFNTSEKLILSPFIFSDVHEQEVGLFGLQNIQLIMNMTAPSLTASNGRVLRFNTSSYKNGATKTATWSPTAISYNPCFAGGSPWKDSKVNVQFLTPSLDLPLPPKSIVNYMEFPRYISVVSGGATNWGNAAPYKLSAQSQTISLPCIPDLLIIYAKPTVYTPSSADYYLPITKISVNFDNFAGLLSSHTPQQLYNMSRANGLDMSYEQWIGSAYTTSGNVPLVGGFLVLKPSKDITLSTGQAPSLIGNFTFQFNCDITSPTNYTGDVNLWVITANSGFFESQKGSSRVIKGILNEKDIIDAPLSSLSTRVSINRAVGGASFKNMLGNAISKVQEYLPIARQASNFAKPLLNSLGGDTGRQIAQGLSSVGLGKHHRGSLQSRLM